MRREPSIRRALFFKFMLMFLFTHPPDPHQPPLQKSGEEHIVYRPAALTRMVEIPG